MNQDSLFEDYIAPSPYRRNSPSSREAAELVDRTLPERCQDIINGFRQLGRPASIDEVAELVGVSILYARPRINTHLSHLVELVDYEGKTASGNRQARYQLRTNK